MATKEELENENLELQERAEKAEGALAKAKADLVDAQSQSSGTQVDLSEYKDGAFLGKDGEVYQLKIVTTDDPRRWTHKLRNQVHSWEGTREDFEAQFKRAS